MTAEEFARLTIRADGWPEAEPMPEKDLGWLEAKFKEHLGAASVGVEALHQLRPRPFGDGST